MARRISEAQVRSIAKALPGTEEGTSYGTLAFRVGKKLLLRMHQKEPAVVIRTDGVDIRDDLIASGPAFYITPHYEGSAYVLAHLGRISRAELAATIEMSWRSIAHKSLIRAHDDKKKL